MNILEQYIVEVHSVEPYVAEWTKDFPDKEFVEVDVTSNCYGSKTRSKHIFNTVEWAEYLERGYWMG